MMNETAATLIVPMWVIGLIMPVSAILAILAILDSLRIRRARIELPDLGLPTGQAMEADVNVPDLSRQTPLHFAAAAGHTSLIEILLSDIVGNTIDVDVRRNVIHSNDDDENGLYVFLASRR